MLPFASDRFHRLWTAESVRLIEEREGRAADTAANARALALGGTLEQRLVTRATLVAPGLGLRDGPPAPQAAAALMAVLAVIAGAAVARASLGDGSQPVSLLQAWFVLLAWPLLTLLVWLGMSWPRRSKPSGGWLGDSWLAFSQWLSRRLGRSGRAGIQLEAWQGLMRQHGLSRYGLGLIVHGLWLLALVAAALTWIGLTLVRRYEFVWETTLLETSQVGVVVQALSAWPSLLGISLPDPQVMRTTAAGDTLGPQGQRQWALWLLGNVLAYGLLPRALCLLGCAWAWRAGQARLALDPSEPGYHALVPALMPAHQSLGIIDADPGRGAARHPAPGPAGEGAWVLGFELAPDTPWPPMLPEGVVNAGLVDDSTQRRRILERLAARPAARVLVVCDQARSPDRGTLSFLRQLSQVAGAVRVYLAPSATEASATVASTTGADLADQAAAPVLPDAERQADWQAALQAQGMQPVDDWPAAWLTGTAT